MKGSVKKDGSKWFYVVDLGKDEYGKRIQKKKRGFKTKKEAQNALNVVINQILNGTYIEPSKTTYADFLNDWLVDKRNSVKQQTIENYCLISVAHIIPALGSIPVQKIAPAMIQKFVNDLRNHGLSNTYIRKALAIVNSSLKKAEQWGMIPKNPSSLIEKPSIVKKEMKVWDEYEVKRFLEQAKDDRLYIAFILAVTTGMRQGEILGLRWKDVDFTNGSLSVRQTLSHDGKNFLTGAKTKSSVRSIYLPTETIQSLKKHRAVILQEKLKAGEEYTDLDLVVCTAKGTQVIPSNLNRTWWRLQLQAGVNRIRFHDLRHTHATLLLKQGIHVKVVAERLGHNDTRMTLDTYTHILPSMQKEAVNVVSQLIFAEESIHSESVTNL